jgi:hypothetical protein
MRSRRSNAESTGQPGPGARHFLYLDAALARELLAGLEQGIYTVERTSTDEQAGRQLGGKLGVNIMGAGVGVDAGKTAGLTRHAEKDLEQTPESQFARLIGLLAERGELRKPDVEALDDLAPGDMLQITGSFTIHDTYNLGTAVSIMQLRGRDLTDATTARRKVSEWLCKATVSTYRVARDIPGIHIDPAVVATSDAGGEAFKGRLDAQHLRVKLEPDQQYGTVVAKLESHGSRGPKITVVGIYR